MEDRRERETKKRTKTGENKDYTNEKENEEKGQQKKNTRKGKGKNEGGRVGERKERVNRNLKSQRTGE